MSKVQILDIKPRQTLYSVNLDFVFDVHLQVYKTLKHSSGRLTADIQWRVIYIGSSESDSFDQVLTEFETPFETPD